MGHSVRVHRVASLPAMARGGFVADLVAVIGSLDVVLGDIDR